MRQGDLVKLVRILGMLGSDHAGERASAALAAHRLVRASGESWAALLSPYKVPRAPRGRVFVDIFHDAPRLRACASSGARTRISGTR